MTDIPRVVIIRVPGRLRWRRWMALIEMGDGPGMGVVAPSPRLAGRRVLEAWMRATEVERP